MWGWRVYSIAATVILLFCLGGRISLYKKDEANPEQTYSCLLLLWRTTSIQLCSVTTVSLNTLLFYYYNLLLLAYVKLTYFWYFFLYLYMDKILNKKCFMFSKQVFIHILAVLWWLWQSFNLLWQVSDHLLMHQGTHN